MSNKKKFIIKNGFSKNYSLGQKAADLVSRWAGSWKFITLFFLFILFWAILNTYLIIFGIWDVYPFILLNLVLSCLAAIQAPIILMSQNRQSEIDRQKANYDYLINRRSEKEIKLLRLDVLEIKQVILKQSTKTQTDSIRKDLQKIKVELERIDYSKNNLDNLK
ncbi:MAG: DUF1003 domain-containing protein [Candidatus ainarchaeum sp.]|nr:DUF1003 domain-containing protein [Candidatus ainarchaeum sp.]